MVYFFLERGKGEGKRVGEREREKIRKEGEKETLISCLPYVP